MSKITFLTPLAIYLFMSFSLYGQKAFFSKEKYNLYEPVELVIEAVEPLNFSALSFPNIEGLEYIGVSQNFKKINQKNFYFYYFLFKPKKIGTIRFPRLEWNIKGKKIQVKEQTVTIYSVEQFPNLSEEEAWKLNPHDVLLEIQFNKTYAYVGEPIQQKVSLYIRDIYLDKIYFEPQSVQNLLQQIKNTQFWEENIDSIPFQNVSFEYKNGIRYQKFLLNLSYLYALSPGSVHYESIPLKIKKRKFLNLSPLYNPFEEVTIKSNSLDLQIRSTPFPNLLTGEFQLTFQKIPSKIHLGEKVLYKFSIQGNGNLNTYKNNPLKINKKCDVFETERSIKRFFKRNELYYSLNIEYQIMPLDTGNYVIEPILIPYFHTSKRTKELLSIPKQSFRVEDSSNKIVENHDIKIDYTESESYTGWNATGIIFLLLIVSVILGFIVKNGS